MEEKKNGLRTDEGVQVPERTVKVSEIQDIVAAAVAAALAAQKHQHSPIVLPELTGRSREEGVLIETKTGETKDYIEVTYNDGMVRRDYK